MAKDATDLSRRNFFRSGVREMLKAALEGAAETVRAQEPAAPAPPRFLRPPGALREPEFLAACTRCDACIAACPKWVVRRAGHELGAAIEGTPILLPETGPCWLCEDLPCIAACEPGALLPVGGRENVRMGVARVDEARCFAAQGNICDSCQERCPVRPRAITVSFGSPPEVEGELCTGCGICVYLCPADAVAIDAVAVAREPDVRP